MKTTGMSDARTGRAARSNTSETAEAAKTPGAEMAVPDGWKPTRLARILEVLQCILARRCSAGRARERAAGLSADDRDETLDESGI
jgi:hypothetical protein